MSENNQRKIITMINLVKELISNPEIKQDRSSGLDESFEAVISGLNYLAKQCATGKLGDLEDDLFVEDEGNFKKFFDAVPVGVFVMNSDYKPIFANEASFDMLGKGIIPSMESEDIAKVYNAVITGTDSVYPVDSLPILRALKGEEVYVDDMTIKRDDSDIAIEVWARPIYNSKKEIIYAVATFNKIDNVLEKQKQILSEKDQAIEDSESNRNFLANMSHEIRTPLNSIVGFTKLLKDKPTPELGTEYLEAIDIASNSLLHIVNEVLDFSKLEAGQMAVYSETFSPRKVIEDLKFIFAHELQLKNISLKIKISKDVPFYLNGDVQKISQILRNLIGNAIKFTSGGQIGVEMSGEFITEDYYKIECIVSDSGIGISAERMESIFHAYIQENELTTAKYGGTGLGLAISRKLAVLMKGDVKCKSEIGKGSEFIVTALLKKSDEVFNEENQIKSIDTESLKDMRVLLAEDNPMNVLLCKNVLSKLNIVPDVVENGQEALNAVQQKTFDLVIMDLQMPVMDGMEATSKIRNLDSSIGQVPIIALTAHASNEYKKECLEKGFNDFLSKPFKSDELFKVMKNLMKVSA